ncbi:hypothetical protein JVU11DRAFT_6779 [Chiua virens]|nr:hypothetical protein JVU11DRAFT_6779 [Chiua virens]
MGKNKNYILPNESHLVLPAHSNDAAASTPIIDTHTHLLSTFSTYKTKYPTGKYDTVWDFVRGVYHGRNVAAIVDVWCEAPVQRAWKELADSAVSAEDRAEKWGGIEYWFVMGVHPHGAKFYNDSVEQSIIDAMAHPRCVGWGEIGLDYHYDNSPRQLQQRVFGRQLRAAVKLGKPLTIHTREAEADTERILKREVPPDYKIHIHCFTDSPEFAQRLLAHFPNLYIGITGVISYSTNLNTAAIVRHLALTSADASASASHNVAPAGPSSDGDACVHADSEGELGGDRLRILLETDAPFMVPSNLYMSLPRLRGSRLPLCHTAMIPWVADFTAGIIQEGRGARGTWGPAEVMKRANVNARFLYSI